MVRKRGEYVQTGPTAVMLAGAIQPPPLRRTLGVPLLSLPLGHGHVLLDAWFDVLVATHDIRRILVLVNTTEDAQYLRDIAPISCELNVEIMPEPAHWRGSAGLLHDAAMRLDAAAIVGIEAHRLPPRSLEPMMHRAAGENVDALVGVAEHTDEPAGVYYFSRRALEQVPGIGFLDLKEQFLPALHRAGVAVWPTKLKRGQYQIRDRAGYLRAVRAMLKQNGARKDRPWVAPNAEVSSRARIEGSCIVESGATIESGAIVHQSVVMQHAIIRSGAVVSRAVVGRRARVGHGARVIDQTVQ